MVSLSSRVSDTMSSMVLNNTTTTHNNNNNNSNNSSSPQPQPRTTTMGHWFESCCGGCVSSKNGGNGGDGVTEVDDIDIHCLQTWQWFLGGGGKGCEGINVRVLLGQCRINENVSKMREHCIVFFLLIIFRSTFEWSYILGVQGGGVCSFSTLRNQVRISSVGDLERTSSHHQYSLHQVICWWVWLIREELYRVQLWTILNEWDLLHKFWLHVSYCTYV